MRFNKSRANYGRENPSSPSALSGLAFQARRKSRKPPLSMALPGRNHAKAPQQPFRAHPAHPNLTAAVWRVRGQPGGPSPGAGQLRAVSLMLWHCWSGRLPMELLLPNPTTSPDSHPAPTPQNLRATSSLPPEQLLLPERFWRCPPGKRAPCLWGVCDVSLRLFPNHHIKLQRFSSPGLLYSPIG